LSKTLAAAALIAGQAFWSAANARQSPLAPTYWIQLDNTSVESTRSRRTDTNYAVLSVQANAGEARTTSKRLGDVGRGTKAVNMSLSRPGSAGRAPSHHLGCHQLRRPPAR
jgi:hypothetical protein